jgi:hypothetical protein
MRWPAIFSADAEARCAHDVPPRGGIVVNERDRIPASVAEPYRAANNGR